MLNDIELSYDQWETLACAASLLGAGLRPSHRGKFRPSGEFCVGVVVDRASRLAQWLLAVAGTDRDLALVLAARGWEEEMGRRRIYFFPGVRAPQGAEVLTP
jgi:hypothetical protein